MAAAVLRRLSTMEQTALEAKDFLSNEAYWTLGKEDAMDVEKPKKKRSSPVAAKKKSSPVRRGRSASPVRVSIKKVTPKTAVAKK